MGGRSQDLDVYGEFGGGGRAGGRWRGEVGERGVGWLKREEGGGGGGYSVGGSGDHAKDACRGGGGSYNVGNNQHNECCYNNAGHDQVIITLL